MKTLYLECTMGAAGDMFLAALLELHPDPEAFVSRFNQLGIPGVTMKKEKTSRCGITGTHVSMLVDGKEEDVNVGDHDHDSHIQTQDHIHKYADEYTYDHEHTHEHTHHHEHTHEHTHHHEHTHEHTHHHEHHSLSDINTIVEGLPLSDKVKADILAVFRLIAEAETQVHDRPVVEIHFHEVGTMDAIADVTAVSMLMDELGAERVIVSPVCTGSGTVHCAHGVLPVPAPATAYLLKGIPAYAGEIRTELCTPTGAALLKHFASSFGAMPVMRTEAIGYGCGKKELEMANILRAFLGNMEEKAEAVHVFPGNAEETGDAVHVFPGNMENGGDAILELECNIDDMTGEEIGFACEELIRGGAKDVFTVPVQMKKNRPGVLLKVICSPSDQGKMVSLIFKHTTTIGIRLMQKQRCILQRTIRERSGRYGNYAEKESSGYGVVRKKAEYEDLAGIARENDLSLIDLRKLSEE